MLHFVHLIQEQYSVNCYTTRCSIQSYILLHNVLFNSGKSYSYTTRCSIQSYCYTMCCSMRLLYWGYQLNYLLLFHTLIKNICKTYRSFAMLVELQQKNLISFVCDFVFLQHGRQNLCFWISRVWNLWSQMETI